MKDLSQGATLIAVGYPVVAVNLPKGVDKKLAGELINFLIETGQCSFNVKN